MYLEITTPEQAKEAIVRWFKENKLSVKEIRHQDANFQFEIVYPQGSETKQLIVQPKEVPGLIMVIHGVNVSPNHVVMLKKMRSNEREVFYQEIRSDLLFLENSFQLRIKEGILEGIQFSYEFYFDALTKTQLFKAINVNYRTYLYVIMKFQGRFGGPAPTSESTAMYR